MRRPEIPQEPSRQTTLTSSSECYHGKKIVSKANIEHHTNECGLQHQRYKQLTARSKAATDTITQMCIHAAGDELLCERQRTLPPPPPPGSSFKRIGLQTDGALPH
eukprot:6181764-Pleurochrysis_carterae.AAC.1